MSLTMLLTAVLIGPQASPSPDDWRQEYQSVMTATADRAKSSPATAVPRLISVYVGLADAEALPRSERTRMRRSLESRLVKQLEVLVREKRKSDQVAQRTSKKSQGGGGATTIAAQQLIDLIVNTIAPDSWQQNGGKGSITYYPINPALVIRQTGETHEQVSQLLQALGK